MINQNTCIVLLLIATAVGAHQTYCPQPQDIHTLWHVQREGLSVYSQGWTLTGSGAVATKAAFNLLGGSVEFDIDLSRAKLGVNPNIYTISPRNINPTTGYVGANYCDGQGTDPSKTWCVEIDWIETNGYCGGQTTVHTFMGSNHDHCDKAGCAAPYLYNGRPKFHMKIVYDTNGRMHVQRDGQWLPTLNRNPQDAEWALLAQQYRERGAVLYSSQWSGFVPHHDCGSAGGGDINGSTYSIQNLRITGTVVQGPTPTRC